MTGGSVLARVAQSGAACGTGPDRGGTLGFGFLTIFARFCKKCLFNNLRPVLLSSEKVAAGGATGVRNRVFAACAGVHLASVGQKRDRSVNRTKPRMNTWVRIFLAAFAMLLRKMCFKQLTVVFLKVNLQGQSSAVAASASFAPSHPASACVLSRSSRPDAHRRVVWRRSLGQYLFVVYRFPWK